MVIEGFFCCVALAAPPVEWRRFLALANVPEKMTKLDEMGDHNDTKVKQSGGLEFDDTTNYDCFFLQ